MQKITAASGSASPHSCDVSDQKQVISTFDHLAKQSRIDILVNNAGISQIGNVDATPEDAFDWPAITQSIRDSDIEDNANLSPRGRRMLMIMDVYDGGEINWEANPNCLVSRLGRRKARNYLEPGLSTTLPIYESFCLHPGSVQWVSDPERFTALRRDFQTLTG